MFTLKSFSRGWGDYAVGFNLFTGRRTNYNGDKEKENQRTEGRFGEIMPHNFVKEEGPRALRYRMGAAYLAYGEYKAGVNSDRWVRHPIQDNWAHNMKIGKFSTRQPGFESLSDKVTPYLQFKTIKQGIRFSLYE